MCEVVEIFLALISRLLFAAHGIWMVLHVVAVTSKSYYWLLLIGVALLTVETAVTIKCTRNGEWKWFSPMIILYLSTVIPAIWFLELHLMDPKNTSSPDGDLTSLKQTMLFVLVLGRWLMPRGGMSRDQLSQLLQVYLGQGVDSLEILNTFMELREKENKSLVIIVGLSLFSWTLMKFSFIRKPGRPGLLSCFCTSCRSCEALRRLLTIGHQDGPLMVYRIYLIIMEKMRDQMIIFFTCKNILMVMLQLYSIIVILCGPHEPRERSPDDPQSLEAEGL